MFKFLFIYTWAYIFYWVINFFYLKYQCDREHIPDLTFTFLTDISFQWRRKTKDR